MVSQKRARARHRNIQCRFKCRSDHRAAGCALALCHLRMAVGVHLYRHAWPVVAVVLVLAVPASGRTSEGRAGGTCLHPVRSGRAHRKNRMVKALAAPSDLGLCNRKVSYRFDLAMVSLPVAVVLQSKLQTRHQEFWTTLSGDLRF